MKPTFPTHLLLMLTTLLCLVTIRVSAQNHTVAGSFYPADKGELESELSSLFATAKPVQFEGPVQSLIVPHAGFDFSGMVTASGFKSIATNAQYKNVFILASSQKNSFKGISVYNAGNYITPLGEAKVNRDIAMALINNNVGIDFNEQAHKNEHLIEVQIPFIQYRFENTPIVPILLGSSSLASARDLAAALVPYYTPENLFIISSNFSQYPTYEDALHIDAITGAAIFKNDPEHFYNTLRKNSAASVPNLSTSVNGWSSIMTMLYLSSRREDLTISPILYQNSGDVAAGNKERVIGYWAIAGHIIQQQPAAFTLNAAEKLSLLEIARNTLELFINKGELASVPESSISKAMDQPAGVYVSLYMGERLRGQIGNFSLSNPLYLSVQEMTLAAAVSDQRFASVESSDLEYIQIEISVLTPLQQINSLKEFQLGKHGIYMMKDGKSGTYLPQVSSQMEWSAEELMGHCAKDILGIDWEGWKEAQLYIFEATVFGEEQRR